MGSGSRMSASSLSLVGTNLVWGDGSESGTAGDGSARVSSRSSTSCSSGLNGYLLVLMAESIQGLLPCWRGTSSAIRSAGTALGIGSFRHRDVMSINRVVMLVSVDNVDDGLRYQMLLAVEEGIVESKQCKFWLKWKAKV